LPWKTVSWKKRDTKVGNIVGYLIKGGIVITEKGEILADVAIDNQTDIGSRERLA
jgi:hypothetical protein